MADLPFDGSLWCNIDITLRRIERIYEQELEGLDLSIIEAYILWALYEQDGQHASQLAKAVGRAATSFTPILDKLQYKEFIERRSDPADRRAIFVHLTSKAEQARKQVMKSLQQADTTIAEMIKSEDRDKVNSALLTLQKLPRS